MDRLRATEKETAVTAELDLSVSKHMSGCGTGRTKTRKNNNELKQNDASMQSTLNSVLSPSVSLDPTSHALMPTRSSISSLLSMSHLRLWENPITASAISAAAAMTHLMDINNSAFNSTFGGKSSEENRVNSSGNICFICGRVARNHNELENHMLTHSMEKSFHCLKYGLTQSRINGLLTTSKKRKSKHLSQSIEQPLDVSMPDVRRKRTDDCPNTGSIGCHSPNAKSSTDSMNNNAFPCTSCHKTFATEVDLKAHLMRHLTQHPFVCLACGKGFKYEHSLNFHIKSYHNSGSNNNNNNNNNINLNNKNISKNSPENEIKISNSHILNDSSEKKNENNDKLNLETASELDNDNDDETSIDGEHTDEDNGDNDENHNKSQCSELGAPPLNLGARSIQIKSEKLLITMLEGIHPVTEQSYILYKCCLCGFAFPSLEPVIVHLQTSHLNTNKEFTCDKCGANFKWRSELTLHEQLHKAMDHNDRSGGHLSVPSFMQPNLVLMSTDFGQNMSPNHSFETNNNNINNNNIKSEEMSTCDEKLIPSQYRPHKKSYLQTKPLKLKSESQQHSYDIKSEGIQNAVQLSHKFPTAVGDIVETSPGQFKCRFCDKTFDRIFSVHRHERVHTGFKPCICKTCGRGFSEKRNLRHHIIRFHSDGSGRELLKRNRKDRNNASDSNKRKLVTSLKKTALKILNGNDGNESDNKINTNEDNLNHRIDEQNEEHNNNEEQNNNISSNKIETSITCPESTNALTENKSSSNRRRKGKPSKKIIMTEEFSPEESSSLSNEDSGETHIKEEKPDIDTHRNESLVNSESEINPNDFLETKLRCHGAFFSSYNPRLGVVEKPVKRNEACRPLMGPDGKFLYPCTYCNKTFCSLSDLNRHMNFHEDVRPFKCEFCNYQSRTNSQLKVHMMRHAGIKQYLCSICNYNGVTQSDLNRHCKTRSHALRSANICPLCSLGFSTRTLLDEHIIKFHETSESSSNSSEKSNKNSNSGEKCSEQNSNELSLSSKSFSVKEILN